MTPQTIPQTVLFPDLFDKPLVATFDRQHASSDGGAVLLKAAERVYGLVAGFARCLVDRRELGKIRHTLTELLGQRIFGIACGHPDGNDADHLADDPIHKLLLGRDPVAGEALASQPTISRFENGVGRSALYELARELAMRVIERHQRRRHCQLVEGSALLPREIDAPDRFQQAHVTASHSTNTRVRSRRW